MPSHWGISVCKMTERIFRVSLWVVQFTNCFGETAITWEKTVLPSTWDTLFQDLSHGLPLLNYSHGYKRLRAMFLFIKTVLYTLKRHFTIEQVKYFLTLLKVHTDLPKTTKQVSSFKCFLINLHKYSLSIINWNVYKKRHIYDKVFTPSICDYNLCFDKTWTEAGMCLLLPAIHVSPSSEFITCL